MLYFYRGKNRHKGSDLENCPGSSGRHQLVPGRKDITATANRMPPLGLLSIAAYLERAGHAVSVVDCLGPDALSGADPNARRILGEAPELVGFSTTTAGFLDAYGIASRIKALSPDTPVIFGGVHVSALGGPLLHHFSAIDYLCMGEGERTLTDLAAGMPMETIAGLVWRDNGRAVTNPPREPIADLDSLPFPAYEKLTGFPKRYHLPLFSYVQAPGATMVTSRGCPYQCSYCDRSVFKRSFRYNSAAYVYTHMRYLRRRFGIRHLNIYDDLFTLNRRRIIELCDLLAARPWASSSTAPCARVTRMTSS